MGSNSDNPEPARVRPLTCVALINAARPRADVAILHSDKAAFYAVVNADNDATGFGSANGAAARNHTRTTGTTGTGVGRIPTAGVVRGPSIATGAPAAGHSRSIITARTSRRAHK